jgi:hypothetical protein
MSDRSNFHELLNGEFHWRRRGELPFIRTTWQQDNADMESHLHSRLVMVMTSYTKAADPTVERATAD